MNEEDDPRYDIMPSVRSEMKRLREELAEHEKRNARILRMIEIADRANDAQTEQEVALSASFSEAMSLTMLEHAEQELAGVKSDRDALAGKLQQLEGDAEEQHQLRDRMSGLLTGVANALKGAPGPLSLHDWSDLPKVATERMRENDRLSGSLLKIAMMCEGSDIPMPSGQLISDIRTLARRAARIERI